MQRASLKSGSSDTRRIQFRRMNRSIFLTYRPPHLISFSLALYFLFPITRAASSVAQDSPVPCWKDHSAASLGRGSEANSWTRAKRVIRIESWLDAGKRPSGAGNAIVVPRNGISIGTQKRKYIIWLTLAAETMKLLIVRSSRDAQVVRFDPKTHRRLERRSVFLPASKLLDDAVPGLACPMDRSVPRVESNKLL